MVICSDLQHITYIFPHFFMHHTTVRSVSLFAFYFPFYLLDFSSFYPKTEAKKAARNRIYAEQKKVAGGKTSGHGKSFLISTDVSIFFLCAAFRLSEMFYVCPMDCVTAK